MILPDKWGQGAIFSYSAAYGQCKESGSFYARLCSDRLGLVFLCKNKCTLSVFADAVLDISFDFVMTDYIKARLKCPAGEFYVSFVFASQDTVIINSDYAIDVKLDFEDTVQIKKDKKAVLYCAEGENFALASKKQNGTITYAFCYGKKAGESAEEYFENEHSGLTEQKDAFYSSLPEFRIPNKSIEKLYYKCASVLLAHISSPDGIIKSRYITPAKESMNSAYSFWSAVCTLGIRHIAPDIAKETLESILYSQAGDGMISASISPSGKNSDVNPPVLAWCFWELYQVNNDKQMLSDAYASLKKYLHYLMESRDINKNHLFEWQIGESEASYGAESTMINSPRFDDGIILDSIDFTSYIANEAYCMSAIAEEIDKHGEALYWNVVFERIRTAVNELLFDEDDKIYYDRAVVSGMFKKSKTAASFLPLFSGICENRHAMSLLKLLNNEDRFNLKFGIPSVSADSEDYCGNMWRGPMHPYLNYFISKGLEKYDMHDKANEIKAKCLDTVLKEYENNGVLYEYYSPDGSTNAKNLPKLGYSVSEFMFASDNVNIRDFAPTAAIIIDMLLSRNKKLASN